MLQRRPVALTAQFASIFRRGGRAGGKATRNAWSVQPVSAVAAVRRRLRPYARTGLLALLTCLIAWVTFAPPYTTRYDGPPIRSDGVGYHVWTRAILNGELSFCEWRGAIENFVSRTDAGRKFCQNKYPPGLALVRLPIMGFLVERHPANLRAITPREHQASLILGGLYLWLQAALMLLTAAQLRLRAFRTSLAVLLTLFGTAIFHWGTYDSTFTHAYTSFFCELLLFLALREHALQKPMPSLLIALAAFCLVAIRNTNVLMLAELTLAYVLWRPLPGVKLLRSRILPVVLGAGAFISWQLAYNYLASGSLAASSYGEEGFIWDRPMQWSVMFSYERGLFTYFPLFGVAVVSGLCVPSARKATWLLLALIGTYVGLYGFWHSWMLGDGMGHRGFVDFAPVVALVLCLAWQRMHGWALAVSVLAAVLSTAVTLQIMLGYWDTSFPTIGATRNHYWTQLRKLPSEFRTH